MDAHLQHLILSKRLADISIEAAAVYIFLRVDTFSGRHPLTKKVWDAEKKLASFTSVHSIGLEMLKCGQLRVNMALKELQTIGWIVPVNIEGTDGWVIGEHQEGKYIFYTDEPQTQTQSIVQQVRQEVRPPVKKPNPPKKKTDTPQVVEIADSLLSTMHPDAIRLRIYRHYVNTYERVFGKFPSFMKLLKEKKLVGQLFTLNQESVKNTENYVNFVLENWSNIKVAYNLRGEPAPSLLCQVWVYGIINDAMMQGIRGYKKDVNGMADRAGKGWETESNGW